VISLDYWDPLVFAFCDMLLRKEEINKERSIGFHLFHVLGCKTMVVASKVFWTDH
jgi:hypothetical protein